MCTAALAEIRRLWREDVFSSHLWRKDTTAALAPGEAGGFRVQCGGIPYGAYLKPTRICDQNTPRSANEKIVADLATDLAFSVPPALLYRRTDAPAGEETRCCVSLVLYGEQHNWGLLKNLASMEPVVRDIVSASLARYSGTVALDVWIGQTDRNNDRNAIFGVNPMNRSESGFVFLDHAFTLNNGNRWAGNGWETIEMVPLPAAFRDSLEKNLALDACDRIGAFAESEIAAIVNRIPEEFMCEAHRNVVVTGLNGRKGRLRDFMQGAL
jgi:hypothetical protein